MLPEWERAARSGNVEALEQMLDAGVDIDAKDAQNQTALMLAAAEGHVGAVSLLASRGAGLDHAAKYHLTALMLAIVRGHGQVARALAAAGADPRIRGTGAPGFSGRNAIDLARARDEHALADWLERIQETGEQSA